MKLFSKWVQIGWSYPVINQRVDLLYNILTVERVYVDIFVKKKWNGKSKFKQKIVARDREPLYVKQLTF